MANVLETLLIKVKGDTRDYRMAMRRVKGETDKAKGSFRTLQRGSAALKAALIGVGVGGAAVATKRIFELGAAVEETASKYRTVFGPAVQETNAFLDEFATKAGLSRVQAQELVATTGAIAQGMGFAQDASAGFAEEATRLAADIASFNNAAGGTSQVLSAIQSSIAGEREQLKQFGIVIREAEVQQRALANTSKAAAKELTQAEKATATLQLITEKAGVAVGDLARTKDSAANTARRVTARFRDLRDHVASEMLPTMAQMLGAVDDNTEGLDSLKASVSGTFGALREFFGGIGVLAADAAVGVQKLKIRLLELADLHPFADFSTEITNARVHLFDLTMAAEEVKRDIVDAADAADVLASGAGDASAGIDQMADSVDNLNERLEEFRGLAGTLRFRDTVRMPHQGLTPGPGRVEGKELRFDPGPQGGSGRHANLAQIDAAIRATAALADASGELSDEARGAVRGLSDVVGGLQGLQGGGGLLGKIAGFGSIFGGVVTVFQSVAGLLDDNNEALEENTRAIRAGSLSRRSSLTRQLLEVEGVTSPDAQFNALRQALFDQINALGGNTAPLRRITQGNIDEVLQEVLEQQLGLRKGSAIVAVASQVGIDTDALIDILSEMDRLADATGDAAEEMQKFNSALRNVPTGFKVGLARFNASDPETFATGPTSRATDTDGGGMTPIVVQVDGKTLFQITEREARRANATGSTHSGMTIVPSVQRSAV